MKRFRSKILNEVANVADNGSVTFESGVQYSPAEINEIKSARPEEIKAIHMVKQVFGGDVHFVKDPEAVLQWERSLDVKFPG